MRALIRFRTEQVLLVSLLPLLYQLLFCISVGSVLCLYLWCQRLETHRGADSKCS